MANREARLRRLERESSMSQPTVIWVDPHMVAEPLDLPDVRARYEALSEGAKRNVMFIGWQPS